MSHLPYSFLSVDAYTIKENRPPKWTVNTRRGGRVLADYHDLSVP
ncbi:MAG: hypothetical protein OXB90_03195 [Acidimicrobiaceae bacterium]|nr:hypothetical protein [Acidimicrobiaceae bacterium]